MTEIAATGTMPTAEERAALKKAETAIKTAFTHEEKRDEAFWNIRENRLYREHHSTFALYLKEVWDLEERAVNHWIQAHEVRQSFGTIVPKINSGQARVIAGLEADKGYQWTEKLLLSIKGRITAKAITDAANAKKAAEEKARREEEERKRAEREAADAKLAARIAEKAAKDAAKAAPPNGTGSVPLPSSDATVIDFPTPDPVEDEGWTEDDEQEAQEEARLMDVREVVDLLAMCEVRLPDIRLGDIPTDLLQEAVKAAARIGAQLDKIAKKQIAESA